MTEHIAPMTQTERVLAMLVAHRKGVCGVTFLERRIPRYAARILDLKGSGHLIERTACPYPEHSHTGAVATYRLVTNVEQTTGTLTLPV